MARKFIYFIFPSLLISTATLAAEESPFSYKIGVTSDYIARGISQTKHDPAVYGAVDFAGDSGLYAGFFMSTQKWVSAPQPGYKPKIGSDFEFNISGGLTRNVGDFSYDLGLIYYIFDGKNDPLLATPDGAEAYVGVGWKDLKLQYSRVISHYLGGWGEVGGKNSRGTTYLELAAEHDLGSGWGVFGHVGRQNVKNHGFASFNDWGLGVSKDVGFGVLSAVYADTNADSAVYTLPGEKCTSKGALSLSFEKIF